MKKHYLISKTENVPDLAGGWNGKEWENANILDVDIFREKSTNHRPETKAKLLYNDKGIYAQFKVKDQYVRAVNTTHQSSVAEDSCVEFFVKPKPKSGYFNFEFNCGGALLCYYITDHTRINCFAEYAILKNQELDMLEIYHSLPQKIYPEITEPIEWSLAFLIPFHLLEIYAGNISNISGKTWSGNFYKCGQKTSHPHWASWNPLTETNFHLPECFGNIEFESVAIS